MPIGEMLALIDRAKEILLSRVHDHEKVHQICWLLGVEPEVKIEEDLID